MGDKLGRRGFSRTQALDRDSVREHDPEQGISNPEVKPHTLPPDATPNIKPKDVLFVAQTITLPVGTTQTIPMDQGAEQFIVYIPGAQTSLTIIDVSLGYSIDANLFWRTQISTSAPNMLLSFPAQAQAITVRNFSGATIILTIMALRNCEFSIR